MMEDREIQEAWATVEARSGARMGVKEALPKRGWRRMRGV
jgi:hypothetical protein